MNGAELAPIPLTVDLLGSQSHSPFWIHNCETNSNWQNLHNGSLTRGAKAIVIGEAKWKSLELPLPTKPKQYCIPGENAKISATIQGLKPHPSSTHLRGPGRAQMGLGE